MKFEHKVIVDAPRAKVRAFLDDFSRAAYCVPGIQDVKDLGDDNFEGTIRVRIGPLGLNVGGTAHVERGAEEGSWRVEGEGRDRRVGASMTANVEAKLNELDANRTEVEVIADVTFAGRLAELGQPLIKRKADSFVAEFAENLRKAINEA
ncbi:MAG TPA: SRPBCC domain-containing protein [Dehalococcoidia bacterium]|nr:SRPBCC domain-containing protein [Dehalococcoidia bacterium]